MEHWDVERLLQGVPPDQRAQVWAEVSGIEPLLRASKGLYEELVAKLQHAEKTEWMGDIARDAPRVGFPGAEPVDHEALARVLGAFCLWHPSVCYCQPMGFIAGFLLSQLSEEHTFFVMIRFHLFQCREYWSRGMIGWKVDEKILTDQLELELPALVEHLVKLGMVPAMVFTPWLQCLFVSHLDREAAARVWDLMICCGVHFVHSLTLALFRSVEQQLLAANSPMVVFQLLKCPIAAGQLEEVLREALAREPELKLHYTEQRHLCRTTVVAGVRELFERHYRTQWECPSLPAPAESPNSSPQPSPPLRGADGTLRRGSTALAKGHVERLQNVSKAHASPPPTPGSPVKSVGQSSVRARDDSVVRRTTGARAMTDELSLEIDQGLPEVLDDVEAVPDLKGHTGIDSPLGGQVIQITLLALCMLATICIIFWEFKGFHVTGA